MNELVKIPLGKLISYQEEYDEKLERIKQTGTVEEIKYWEGFCAGLHIAKACFSEVLYKD